MNSTVFLILCCLLLVFLGSTMMAENESKKHKEEEMTLYMNSEKNSLMISESPGNKQKKIGKIYYNMKDYTKFIKKVLDSQPLTFASDKLLIFGPKEIIHKANVWSCSHGTVFIPGESEALIIKMSVIRYNEKTLVLTGKDSSKRRIPLDENLKEEVEELKEMTLDLSNWK